MPLQWHAIRAHRRPPLAGSRHRGAVRGRLRVPLPKSYPHARLPESAVIASLVRFFEMVWISYKWLMTKNSRLSYVVYLIEDISWLIVDNDSRT